MSCLGWLVRADGLGWEVGLMGGGGWLGVRGKRVRRERLGGEGLGEGVDVKVVRNVESLDLLF